MNRPNKASEPSMEEILASIRKIIAEEPPGARPMPDQRAANPLLKGGELRAAIPPIGEGRQPATLDHHPEPLRQLPSLDIPAGADRKPMRPIDDDLADLLDDAPTANGAQTKSPVFASTPPAAANGVALKPADDPWAIWRTTRPGSDRAEPVKPEPAPEAAAAAPAQPAPAAVAAKPSVPVSAVPAPSYPAQKRGFYPPSGIAPGAVVSSPVSATAPQHAEARAEPSQSNGAAAPSSVDFASIIPGRSEPIPATPTPVFSAAAVAAAAPPAKPAPDAASSAPAPRAEVASPAQAAKTAPIAKEIAAPASSAAPSSNAQLAMAATAALPASVLVPVSRDMPIAKPADDARPADFNGSVPATAPAAAPAATPEAISKVEAARETSSKPAAHETVVKPAPVPATKSEAASPAATANVQPAAPAPLDMLAAGLAAANVEAAKGTRAATIEVPAAAATAASQAPVRTLEDAVADMLRPLLQQWLADNMPRIIEKALRIDATKTVASGIKPPAG